MCALRAESGKPLVIAHRGMSGKYPENTMLAIEKAFRFSDLVEIDVQFSKDMEVVVIHDTTVDRTCAPHKGYVADFTLAELKIMDAGAFKGVDFFGERIPTLREMLRLFTDPTRNPEKKKCLIELKFYWYKVGKGLFAAIDLLAEEVTKLIIEHQAHDVVVVQSFVQSYLEIIHKLDKKVETHLLAFPWYSTKTLLAQEFPTCFNPNVNFLTQSFANEIHKQGKGMCVWTVDSEEHMAHCIHLGARGLITNVPEQARTFINEFDPVKYPMKTRTVSSMALFYFQLAMKFSVLRVALFLVVFATMWLVH